MSAPYLRKRLREIPFYPSMLVPGRINGLFLTKFHVNQMYSAQLLAIPFLSEIPGVLISFYIKTNNYEKSAVLHYFWCSKSCAVKQGIDSHRRQVKPGLMPEWESIIHGQQGLSTIGLFSF